MTTPLLAVIRAGDSARRDLPLEVACQGSSRDWLLQQCGELDQFRRRGENLYERVRALFFLASIHRYYLPSQLPPTVTGHGQIPFEGYVHLLQRRFHEAIDAFLEAQRSEGPSEGVSSALAEAYRRLAFQTLADQVRLSVRTVPGNQWMFRVGHPDDHPLRLRPELLRRSTTGAFPTLCERTSVRMDLSHSAWSDIFFLGMDFPEGARVLNVSIDLGVRGRDAQPAPPIESYLRVLDQPILRLVSLDLESQVTLGTIDDAFDFARDYLGLLKAAVIASGLIPPGMEGCNQSIEQLLGNLVGPGLGLEIVSQVNDIPKGSRLAVSTNLLGSLISIMMRATGQIRSLTGGLTEDERRIVAARAILGEWLGGSGGGWQDSGGVWPGIKLIRGVPATEGDPEHGVSRGRLLPRHEILDRVAVSDATRQALANSLVLVHGGMAQNVGPILEMVTEKYLLRGAAESEGRREAMRVLDEVTLALRQGDIRAIGRATTRNFLGPLQAIIPWCTNRYTELLIERTRERFADRFWGFWMLGGMSGGGMGFIFDPAAKREAQDWLLATMASTKRQLQDSLAFAMEPVVYDFAINERGSWAELDAKDRLTLPARYYALLAPDWIRADIRSLSAATRRELQLYGAACLSTTSHAVPAPLAEAAGDRAAGTLAGGALATSPHAAALLRRMLPHATSDAGNGPRLEQWLQENGFDAIQHESIRADLRSGRIGLAQNRLRADTLIEDVHADQVIDTRHGVEDRYARLGREALAAGTVAVVSLAAGVGSRWTQGAGVVKALHPFCKFDGRHRSFLEVHLAKTARTTREHRAVIPHVFTTSYLTHAPLAAHLRERGAGAVTRGEPSAFPAVVRLSPGRSVGLRMIPMARDLRFAWEEMPQQILDEQQQKVRASLRSALIQWALATGEGNDYTDNLPLQCLHPVGHWYEVPNMLRNGTLAELLAITPSLRHLLLHNIDTLGANLDPGLLGLHIARGDCLSFEVINRRLEDRGGGLARVNGRVRIVEGLAMPREEDDFRLSYYNSMTTWIDIDKLLDLFALTRATLHDAELVDRRVRALGQRIATYITIKDVKKRWGHGQEDVYPVSQFEKLWSDMTALAEIDCGFLVVPLQRGQQLKDPAQLDGWVRDGSAAHVASLCDWS